MDKALNRSFLSELGVNRVFKFVIRWTAYYPSNGIAIYLLKEAVSRKRQVFRHRLLNITKREHSFCVPNCEEPVCCSV